MRMLASEVLRRSRQRCLLVLFTALDAAPLAEGLLPVLPMLTARHQVVLASVGDPALTELTSSGAVRRRCTTPRRPRGPWAKGTGWPRCCDVGVRTWSTHRRTASPRRSRTATSSFKAAGRL